MHIYVRSTVDLSINGWYYLLYSLKWIAELNPPDHTGVRKNHGD